MPNGSVEFSPWRWKPVLQSLSGARGSSNPHLLERILRLAYVHPKAYPKKYAPISDEKFVLVMLQDFDNSLTLL